jgi:superfamily I DNA/RNA helicase
MRFIFATKKFVETNIEAAVVACCDLAEGSLPSQTPPSTYGMPSVDSAILFTSASEVLTEPVIVIPIPFPVFSSVDPLRTMEWFRPLVRGIFRAAVSIWMKDREYRRDFDLDGLFYRRPFGAGEYLRRQTVVLADISHRATGRPKLQDLIVVAFGNLEDGLPRLESFDHTCKASLDAALVEIQHLLDTLSPENLRPILKNNIPLPVVTSLTGTETPAWLSYDQWMRRLDSTPQGNFIVAPLSGPQRVDGPAGSGKTLSLVLKALYLLKKSQQEGTTHHSVFVVFSEDTKSKILDNFVGPLDEDQFSERTRSDSRQSLTVTTLLEWSKRDLEHVVDAFQLPSDSASRARQDQVELVKETLDRNLAGLLRGGGDALSHDLRTLCSRGATPGVVRMFLHEFGVVIKGMADMNLRRYLALTRPTIALPITSEADRRFGFALFGKYEELLRQYGVVDLDDVAVSHIKLLQMPLRRETREGLAFDSVFVDEAHSFNPNELAIFFLLTRRAELPPLVVAVDLPQALGDKRYADGGLESAILEEVEASERIQPRRFYLEDVKRCPQPILDLATSIYAQGQSFFSPIRIPPVLKTVSGINEDRPLILKFATDGDMLQGTYAVAERVVGALKCRRSDVLIILMHEGLEALMPKSLGSFSEVLSKRMDVDAERRAQHLNHYVVGRPEFLHGLEFEAVILVGISQNEFPRVEPGIGEGAAAVFETQRAVDLMYLALTRARRRAVLLFVGIPSFLLNSAISAQLVKEVSQ